MREIYMKAVYLTGGNDHLMYPKFEQPFELQEELIEAEPSATMIVSKTRENWFESYREYIVHLDGENLGKLAEGETKEFLIPDGEHMLQSSSGMMRSHDLIFSIRKGEKKTFVVARTKYGRRWYVLGFALLIISILFDIASPVFPDSFGFIIEILAVTRFFFLVVPAFLLGLYDMIFNREKFLLIQDRNEAAIRHYEPYPPSWNWRKYF